MKVHLLPALSLLGFFCGLGLARAAADLPEPGPENAGLRLRFIVTREAGATNDSFQARFDLLNVSSQPITLLADFSDDKGEDFKEYLAANVIFTADPAVMPYMGQMSMPGPRMKPQPEYTLAPGETLTVRRADTGRGHCPTDGLYGFRGSILLRIAGSDMEKRWLALAATNALLRAQQKGTHPDRGPWPERHNVPGSILMRSNEQPVPVGGSHALPKFPMGKLIFVDTNKLTTSFDLGSAHRIEVGDEFRIFTRSIGNFWILKITHTEPTHSVGTLKAVSKMNHPPDTQVLRTGTSAALITVHDVWR